MPSRMVMITYSARFSLMHSLSIFFVREHRQRDILSLCSLPSLSLDAWFLCLPSLDAWFLCLPSLAAHISLDHQRSLYFSLASLERYNSRHSSKLDSLLL